MLNLPPPCACIWVQEAHRSFLLAGKKLATVSWVGVEAWPSQTFAGVRRVWPEVVQPCRMCLGAGAHVVPAKVREALKSCWQPGKMCTDWFKEVKTRLVSLVQDWAGSRLASEHGDGQFPWSWGKHSFGGGARQCMTGAQQN